MWRNCHARRCQSGAPACMHAPAAVCREPYHFCMSAFPPVEAFCASLQCIGAHVERACSLGPPCARARSCLALLTGGERVNTPPSPLLLNARVPLSLCCAVGPALCVVSCVAIQLGQLPVWWCSTCMYYVWGTASEAGLQGSGGRRIQTRSMQSLDTGGRVGFGGVWGQSE